MLQGLFGLVLHGKKAEPGFTIDWYCGSPEQIILIPMHFLCTSDKKMNKFTAVYKYCDSCHCTVTAFWTQWEAT